MRGNDDEVEDGISGGGLVQLVGNGGGGVECWRWCWSVWSEVVMVK